MQKLVLWVVWSRGYKFPSRRMAPGDRGSVSVIRMIYEGSLEFCYMGFKCPNFLYQMHVVFILLSIPFA